MDYFEQKALSKPTQGNLSPKLTPSKPVHYFQRNALFKQGLDQCAYRCRIRRFFQTTISPTMSLFIICREKLFSSLLKARLSRSLGHINWEDLRLTINKAKHFLTWLHGKEPGARFLNLVYSQTQGWLSGLLLISEHKISADRMELSATLDTDVLIDYFTNEVFDALPKTNKHFLMKCTLLPSLDGKLPSK